MLNLRLFALTAPLLALSSLALAQQPVAQNPPADAGSKAADEMLQKTLAAYQNAKSYQSDWTYLSKSGEDVQRMAVEIRVKGSTKLVYHLHSATSTSDKPVKEQKPRGILDPVIPELRVVLDGKTAWFENTSAQVYYKVALPKNTVSSPLMFFPQMATVGSAERGPDDKVGDHNVAVIFAKTKTGGLSRMEIDTASFHIVRIASDEIAGFTHTISTLTVDKETFDGDIPDSTFSYKPPKGFKEMQAPSAAVAIFGGDAPDTPARSAKPDKGK